MGINKKFLEKYEKAYAGMPASVPAFTSPMFDAIYDNFEEWWLPVLPMYVPGVAPNTFYVSNYGRVYTTRKSGYYPNGGIMRPSVNAHGYLQLNLYTPDNQKICCKIARLVMLHFRFVPGCYMLEVDHINGDKRNNTIWNLEWVTPQENTHRAIRSGLRPIAHGVSDPNHVLLTNEQAYELYEKAKHCNTVFELNHLADVYGVTQQYVHDLLMGSIRPYIANMYYNKHMHINSLDEASQIVTDPVI